MNISEGRLEEKCFILGNVSIEFSPIFRTVISSLYSGTAISAFFLNLLVLLAIWKTPSLHKPSFILIANLALTDFLVGILVEPLYVMTNVSVLNSWLKPYCFFWLSCRCSGYCLAGMSLYTLTLISVDRFLAIKLKNRYRTVVTFKRVFLLLIFGWVSTAALLLIVLFLIPSIVPAASLVLTYLLILLLILTISYLMSSYNLKKIKRTVRPINTETGGSDSESDAGFNAKKYQRTLNTMLLVFAIVLGFYSIYVCAAIAGILAIKIRAPRDQVRIVPNMVIPACELIVSVNSTVNPLVYLWRMKDIRRAAKMILKRLFAPCR